MHTVSFLCHGDTEETVSEAEGRVARKGHPPIATVQGRASAPGKAVNI